MPVGSPTGMKFTPGEPPVTSKPAEAGEYPVQLVGKKPWSNPQDPKKFPSMAVTVAIKGTQDEVTHEEKTLTSYLSLSPNQFSQADIGGLAFATSFQEALADDEGNPVTYAKRSDPGCKTVAEWVERMVDAAIASGIIIPAATLGIDNGLGRPQNKVVNWGPPGDAPATEAAGGEEPEAEAEEPPKPAPKAGAKLTAKKGKK